MKILAIASILPVPGIYRENDAIFRFYSHFLETYPQDRLQILRPSAYSNALLGSIRQKWKIYYQVLRQGDYNYQGMEVKVLPFLDMKGSSALLTRLAPSVWWMNKGKIKSTLQSFNPEIVHAHWLFPDGWLACMLKREYDIPYVLTLRRETNFLTGTGAKAAAGEIIHTASAITVLNIRMKEQLREFGYKGPVTMIPHGIEDMFFDYQANPGKERENGPAIITVSRFLDWKYLDRLVEALASLSQTYKFTWTLVGQGPEKARLETLISNHGLTDRVFLKEHVPYEEIPALLSGYDLFALTSYPETFGRVYFEAMATGLPVICSKNSGVDGYFEHGTGGLFADHNDIADIAEQVRKLISDASLRETMGKKAQKIVQEHTWPSVAGKIRDTYRIATG